MNGYKVAILNMRQSIQACHELAMKLRKQGKKLELIAMNATIRTMEADLRSLIDNAQ